jgi:uncharacterized protein (DUF1499 family)
MMRACGAIDPKTAVFRARPNKRRKRMNKHLAWLLVAIGLFGCSAGKSLNTGVRNGKLAECPSSPNCVSSQSTDPQHFVDPLFFNGSAADAKIRLMRVLQGMKRAEIRENAENYIHVEFTSLIFRFVDDVEFLIDAQNQVIQVRSASRIGHSDMGVNRRRVEKIRRKFSDNN